MDSHLTRSVSTGPSRVGPGRTEKHAERRPPPQLGLLDQTTLFQLQKTAGNDAVQQLLRQVVQRDPKGSVGPTQVPSKAPVPPAASKTQAAPTSVAAFMKATFTEAVFRPTSGGGAQFFVQYTPSTETLSIGVKARADFRNSASLAGSTATAEAGVDPFNTLLIGKINDQPVGLRAPAVEEWKWQPADSVPFALKLQKVVADTWSTAASSLSFVLDKPSWPAAKAKIVVTVEVVDAGGKQIVPGPTVAAPDRHLDLTIWKRPANAGVDSQSGVTSKDNVHASMSLSSNSVAGRPDNLLVYDWTPAKNLSLLKGWASDHKSAKTALGASGGPSSKKQ